MIAVPKAVLDVVAGIISDPVGRILVAQRPEGRKHAGFWEFPGGKRETGEPPRDTLVRELREELGIEVRLATRFMVLTHGYASDEKPVCLDFWRVTQWAGVPRGLDGQVLRWCYPSELLEIDLLAADLPLVTALRLPGLFVYEADANSLSGRVRARTAATSTAQMTWLMPSMVSDELWQQIRAKNDCLGVVDPGVELPDGVVAVYSALEKIPAMGFHGVLNGLIVLSAAEAHAGRDAGCDFFLVLDRSLSIEEIEAIGRVGRPYYVNVATDARTLAPPRALLAPKPIPTGQLWWKPTQTS